MSEYVVCETKFRDQKALIEALVEMGLRQDQIEVHDTAQKLVGYQGDSREQRAHIIIRRKSIGHASNDIGFEKAADGSYKAWVSDFDRRTGYGKRIMEGELAKCYSKRVVLGTKVRGCKIKSCVEGANGEIKIRISVS